MRITFMLTMTGIHAMVHRTRLKTPTCAQIQLQLYQTCILVQIRLSTTLWILLTISTNRQLHTFTLKDYLNHLLLHHGDLQSIADEDSSLRGRGVEQTLSTDISATPTLLSETKHTLDETIISDFLDNPIVKDFLMGMVSDAFNVEAIAGVTPIADDDVSDGACPRCE